MASHDSPFLSRWSRRKAQAREGLPVADELPLPLPLPLPSTLPSTLPVSPVSPVSPAAQTAVAPAPSVAPPVAAAPPAAAEAQPALTLDDVALLTRESDYAGFVARSVSPEVKNAALKKLFTDPHFNVMDGLDTYIDDYNKPDPLPEGMLRQMVQSKLLGLFDDDPPGADSDVAAVTAVAPSALLSTDPLPPKPNPADEDADLQLQPDDAAGRPGLEPGTGEDAGRQH